VFDPRALEGFAAMRKRKRYEAVAEDIEYLLSWEQAPPDDATVRRGTSILRRLLLEGDLQRAWRKFGFKGQPIVTGPDIIGMIRSHHIDDISRVERAIYPGAFEHGHGKQTSGFIIYSGTRPPLDPDMASDWVQVEWPLSNFIKAPCIVVDGEIATRRDVIQYFAKRLEGVHPKKEKIRPKDRPFVERLDKIYRTVGGLGPLHREGLNSQLLAIGQAIGRSEDLEKLCQVIRQDNP